MKITSFSQLKQSRQETLEKLTKAVASADNKKAKESDPRFWTLAVDKANNGSAVIRFLPAPSGEDVPFVKIISHSFKGPKGYYVEKSLRTFGERDPVHEYNGELWNLGTEDAKKQASAQKQSISFYSNIYVVKDPANPENEGKVFLYRYGKKIFDKINSKLSPEDEDEAKVDVFCPWEGCNFRLKAKEVGGYRNYDSSDFASPKPLFDNDEEMETVWKQCHSLEALVDRNNPDSGWKTYDELKKRLNQVLDLDGAPLRPAKQKSNVSVNEEVLDEDNLDEDWVQMVQKELANADSTPSISDDEDDIDFNSLLDD